MKCDIFLNCISRNNDFSQSKIDLGEKKKIPPWESVDLGILRLVCGQPAFPVPPGYRCNQFGMLGILLVHLVVPVHCSATLHTTGCPIKLDTPIFFSKYVIL